MLNLILRSVLLAVFVCLAGIRPALAGIIPNPEVTPTPTVPPIIGGLPTPTPTVPPINPPTTPTPTVPPVSTPTVPPINPPTTPTPTVPPVSTPTVPPVPNPNALGKADPQLAHAVIYYGQNGSLPLPNDLGRFQKVALQPDEVITILLTLSPLDYGKPAAVELLDGGSMSTSVTVPKPKDILPTATITPAPSPTVAIIPVESNTSASPTPPTPVSTIPPIPSVDPNTLIDSGALMAVSQAGELIFAFKPGGDAGRHRISVIVGGNQYFLQFWRQDPSAPNTNPRMPHAY